MCLHSAKPRHHCVEVIDDDSLGTTWLSVERNARSLLGVLSRINWKAFTVQFFVAVKVHSSKGPWITTWLFAFAPSASRLQSRDCTACLRHGVSTVKDGTPGHLKSIFRRATREVVHPSSIVASDAFHHVIGPRPCSAMEHYRGWCWSTGRALAQDGWGLTVTVYGRRRGCTCPLMRPPSVAFGGPGSSSQNSSLSTRTRTISPWSMYRRSDSGESSSSWVDVASELGSQKYARSLGSLRCATTGRSERRGAGRWMGRDGE
jgi:hypothetical protein